MIMPTMKMIEDTRSGHWGPNLNASNPIGATTAPANVP
jgi:hypothetical protein